MKKITTLSLFGIVVALLGVLLIPVLAQEVAPGEGGIIIEGNFAGDPANFNPILVTDTASDRIADFLFPGLLGVDPETAQFQQNDPTALAVSWEVSEDNLTYTFTLRDDWTWTDGTPITTADVMYTWNAINSGVVETDLVFLLDIIASVEAPDATTLVVTFKSADCTALNNAGALYPVPSHALPADFAALNDAEFNLNPTVTQGVFNFGELRAGEQVSLLANQSYPGATDGQVLPTGFVYKVVPDQTVLIEQFIAGETNAVDNPPVNARAELLDLNAAGELQMYSYAGNSWDYFAMNFADPNNPQSAFDEAGNPIDQGHHPIFGDPRVRTAVAKGLDVDAMIEAAVFGEGSRMTSLMIPASWAYNADLPFITFDQAAAIALLEEAGWVDDDNDANTPRVAQGSMYAEDGSPFSFVLYTNEGNTRRGAIGTLVQDQLKQIGIAVDFQAIEFNTLLDVVDAQNFDSVIIGWRNGYPDDPDVTQLFTPAGDVVPGGSNFTSYNNPKLEELNATARSLPGCDPAERTPIYHEMQEILQQDLPYVPLFVINGMYGADANVSGFAPYPSQFYWNVDTWSVTP
jgi:peptide/nickel transport system substrate-binding protein